MKLINLKIKNIASIEEAEIQFNEGVLANAPRFLICGDMGTGKSTLLDSICLALYNNTPRLSQAPGDKRNYGSDNITAKDTRNLLRHGATEGRVELIFEGSDGKLYMASWSCGRKSTNTLRDVTLTLTCGHETITDKKEIGNRIKETAVGLDFQQFCRTTLLAQGQFTQFLKSSENEKSAILEKLTQTDIYSIVGKEVAHQRSEKEKMLATLKDEIRGAQLLSDEEITKLNSDIFSYNEQLTQLKLEKEKLDAKIQWVQRVNEARVNLEKAKEKLQGLKSITESVEFQKESSLIRDWTNSSEGRLLLQEHHKMEPQLTRLKTEQVAKGKNAFETVQKELNYFHFSIEERKISLSKLQEQLAQESVHRNMYEHSQTLVMQLKNVENRRAKAQKLHLDAEQLKAQLPALEEKVKKNDENCKELQRQIQYNQREEQTLQEKLHTLNPQQLDEQRNTIDQQLQQLQEARQSCNHLLQIHQKLDETDTQIKNNQQQQQEESDNITQNQVLADERRKHLQQAKEALEQTKLALGDEADRLRAQLHIGDICPICGNTIRQFQETESLQNILKPQQENVTKAEKELSDTESLIKASQKIIENNKKELPSLEENLEKLRNDCSMAETTAQEKCQDIHLRLADPTETLTAIDQKEEALKLEKENIRQQLKAVSEIRDAQTGNQKKQKTLSELEKQAVIELEKARQRVKICKTDIENFQRTAVEERENAEKELDEVREKITWADWEKAWETEPATFIRRLQDAAQRYAAGCEQALQQSHAIEIDAQRLKDTESIRNDILQQWPDWVCDSTEQLPTTDIAGKWKSLSEKARTLFMQIEDLERREDDNHHLLENFLIQHSELTVDRLEELNKLDETKIPILRHQEMERELQSAVGAFQQAEKNLSDVRQLPHPDIDGSETLETMQEQAAEMEKTASQLGVAIGEAQGQLKQNMQHESVVADKKKELDRLQHTVERWQTLSGLFGTNDGAAFRNVAQSFLLQNLVRGANEYLKELTQRYRLDCIPGTLTLSLRDMYQGEAVSPVDTLSGGESFLVSLSLALALSSINRKGFSIDTLFIDEGFGNLSSNELETVLNMLARLQKMNGKRVGIISHVEAVKEHIPVHVEVKRIDPTRSRIEVVDATRGVNRNA